MTHIAVVGGGASGMAAAISAAWTNPRARISIFEKKEKLGKKILATGNGRCNLTNRFMDTSCYRGDHKKIISIVLSEFGYQNTIDFFRILGLVAKSRNDYIYPRSDQALSVVHVLQREIQRCHIGVHTDTAIHDIQKDSNGFILETSEGNYTADKVILACGGKASPSLGSDGSGYKIAKAFGHTITPVVPALVQLKAEQHPYKKAAGVRTAAKVTGFVNGNKIGEDTGEIQITSYGLSGIPVFQISRFISRGLYEGKKACVKIDFFPESDTDKFTDLLNKQKKVCASLPSHEIMRGIFPEKLIQCLFEQAGISMHMKASDLRGRQISALVRACKSSTVVIKDSNGFENAQVCAGGVRTDEISPYTMESRLVPGLYITGELMDVDGICGGYNLQWAWATGYIAGAHSAACKKHKSKDRK